MKHQYLIKVAGIPKTLKGADFETNFQDYLSDELGLKNIGFKIDKSYEGATFVFVTISFSS